MKRTLKRLLCVLLVAMIAPSLAACGGGKSDQQQSSQQTTQDGNSGDAQSQGDSQPQTGLKKLTISHHPVLSGLPAYVAIQKGFFEEEGLDVDMDVYISGASQMEALPSGSWSCGGAGATAGCLGTIGYGLSLLGFVGWDGPIDIFVREGSDIYQAGQGHVDGYPEIYGTAENWKGKEFLLPNGTTAHLALLATLDDLGLKEEDVTITHMEVPAAQNAFLAGEGDGCGQWINFSLQAESYGWKRVTSSDAAGIGIPNVLFASEDIIKNDPDAVVSYIKGYLKAWYWMEKNPEETAALFYQYEMEEGVDTTEENCAKLAGDCLPPSVDEMLAMYEVDETGKTPYYNHLSKVLSYFLNMGKYTQEQVDLALSGQKMNSELMVRALTELKSEGY